MKINRQKIGQIGEQKAQNFLKRRGYQILECNFRTKGGELDIIAKEGDCLVFVEVKTRTNNEYGAPAEAVSFYKQQHMLSAAKYYLSRYGFETECRFDVIEVMLHKKSMFNIAKINHIKNVIQ